MGELRADLQRLIEDPMPYLSDRRAELRRLAAGVLGPRSGDPAVAARLAEVLATDEDPAVRAAAAQSLAGAGSTAPLLAASIDDAAGVREAVAFALGEVGSTDACHWLHGAAGDDPDDGVREAAVAALGAIGDPGSLPLLIELSSTASPKVRRRAIVALSAYESAEALAAIGAALDDRNPMVKEVAEMVVGGTTVDLPWPTSKPSTNG